MIARLRPESGLIVHIQKVTADSVPSLLLSLVPPTVDIQSLSLQVEDGGLVYRDNSYSLWQGCECRLIAVAELRRFMLQIT